MSIGVNSYAGGVGVLANNTAFNPTAQVLQRKILIIGDYDPAITTVVESVPVLVTSAADAGSQFGFGYMLNRLAKSVFRSCGGVPVYCLPVNEGGTPVKALHTATFAGPSSAAGTVYLYINDDRFEVSVASGTAASAIVTACVAAVNAVTDIGVVASAGGVGNVDLILTEKSAGAFGDLTKVRVNQRRGEALPTGVTVVVVDTPGTGAVPDLTVALETGLGTGLLANALGITDVVHGYPSNATVLGDILDYVGAGNLDIGLYANDVARPFRALSAFSDEDLADNITVANGRLTDRANGLVSIGPAILSNGCEVAAEMLGAIAKINNDTAEGSYDGTLLSGVKVSETVAPEWENVYASLDLAEKSGVTPLYYKNGSVYIDKVVSFYRPANVPFESNGYRSFRNISITQNVLASVRSVFESAKWKGIAIVADVAKVTANASRKKVRDIDAVKSQLLGLIKDFEANAWIYDAAPSVTALKAANSVTVRTGGTGFDATLKLVYSGEGGIVNAEVEFDTNVAATTL